MDADFLSTEECAERKGITRQGVAAAIKRGDLPAFQIGRTYVIRREDCDSYQPAQDNAEKGRRNAGKPKTKRSAPNTGSAGSK